MQLKRFLAPALVGAVLLAACADHPTGAAPVETAPAPRVLGLVEITFSGVGTSQVRASVTPVGASPTAGGARAAVIPGVVGEGDRTGLVLSARTTSTLDAGGQRYLQAVFQVRNASPDGTPYTTPRTNVIFLPVGSSRTIPGTPVSRFKKQDGSDADPALASLLLPTGAVAADGNGGLMSQYPDVLQAYTEEEIAAIDMARAPAVTNRFPYGFVVRGPGGTRTLLANPAPGQADGAVTFGYRFPVQAVAADNPFTISVLALAVEEAETRITQSIEEQTAAGQAAFEARAALLGATEVTVLGSGRYGGAIATRILCTIRGSGTPDAPSSVLQSAVPVVGSTLQWTGAQGSTFCLSGGAAGAEYTLVPVNHSNGAATPLTVTGSGIGAVTDLLTPLRMPAEGVLNAGMASHEAAAADEFHLALRNWERSALTPLMRDPSAKIRSRGAGAARRTITPGVPAVGDLWSLNVAPSCAGSLDNRTARVVAIGTRVIIVADTMNPAGGFTTAQYDSIAAEFDGTYSVGVDNFGAPTDLDGNGRVVAFYTRAVNELTPPNSGAFTVGYQTARDLFDANPVGSCPRSNQGELLYMAVPDPQGVVNGNVRSVEFVRNGTVGTMAHELQHLINASRRLYVHNTSALEEVWLNEGLSHILEELLFYQASGLAPRTNISLPTLRESNSRVVAFNRYSGQNFSRLRTWMQRPDTSGAFKQNDAIATRGAIWAFLRYAADRRGGSEAAFWSSLVNTTIVGRANLQAAIGAAPEPWLSDFVVAMFADDAVGGISSNHTNPSWNFRSIYAALAGFSLQARALPNNAATLINYSRGGGASYLRFSVPASGVAKMSATAGGAAPPAMVSFTVMRTR